MSNADNQELSNLGARIAHARNVAGLTQLQLANRVGVSPQAILNLEKGNSKGTRNGELLALALDVNPDWLIKGEGDMMASGGAQSSLAARIKYARKKAGLTQDELAKRIGVTQKAVQHTEAGRSKTTKYGFELSKVLGVNPDWLLSGAPHPMVLPPANSSHDAREGSDIVAKRIQPAPMDILDVARTIASWDTASVVKLKTIMQTLGVDLSAPIDS